jgi:hypothetical protein
VRYRSSRHQAGYLILLALGALLVVGAWSRNGSQGVKVVVAIVAAVVPLAAPGARQSEKIGLTTGRPHTPYVSMQSVRWSRDQAIELPTLRLSE